LIANSWVFSIFIYKEGVYKEQFISINVYEKPMLELSERIDNEHISIEGTLNCLSIAKYENNKVTDIVKIPLS
jgi:hypothetical protein